MRIAGYADWAQSGRRAIELRRLGCDRSSTFALEGAHVGLACFGEEKGAERAVPTHAGRETDITLVADARIDNVDDLRRALGPCADESLPELLIRAYQKWGETFPDQLAGDFALVLWDARKSRLVAARDPFGVRPLVYRSTNRSIWVASQVEQILPTFETAPALDNQMIVEHLLWRHKATDGTFFRDVRQVPPGHVLIATSSGVQLRRYWVPPEPETQRRSSCREDYQEEFRHLFIQSVKRRLRSSTPVLIHVSGGLDSSSIAVAANALARSRRSAAPAIRGAAASYPGLPCDEQAYIDAVAARIDFPIDRWDATMADPADLLDPVLACPNGRIANGDGTKGDVTIAQASGAFVILSGVGGDQLCSPAGVVQDMFANRDWAGAMKELFFFPGATLSSRYARARFVAAHSVPIRIRRAIMFVRGTAPAWLAPDLRSLARELATPSILDVRVSSHVAGQIWTNVNSEQVTRAVDALQRQGGSAGIEYRFPFLDRDLVRFVLALPHQFWPRPNTFARLHREAMRTMLPPEVAGRFGKAEFTPALIARVRRARPYIENLLFDGEWASSRYVERRSVQGFWRTVATAQDARAWLQLRQLWAVATLEAWLRTVLRYYRAH